MKKVSIQLMKIALCGFFIFLLFGCEYDRPGSLFEPGNGAPKPLITSVNPPAGENGITRITISGENFLVQPQANFIYFGTKAGTILSAQTNQLLVERPIDIAGSFMVKVVTREAFDFTEFGPYDLEAGIIQFGRKAKYNAIAADEEGNLFAEIDNIVYRISLSGEISEFGTIAFRSTCMRFGSDGYLYILRRENRDLHRIAPGGGASERYTRIAKRVSYLDLGPDGTIYAGSLTEGLFITSADGSRSVEAPGYLNTFAIRAMRVYEGFVYVAADTITNATDKAYTALFKHEIQDTTLGERQLLLSWKNSGIYAGSVLYDFIFSEDGTMILATDHENPLLRLQADGSITPLYSGTLKGPVTQLAWGKSNYMYYQLTAREAADSGILRVIMGQKASVNF